MAKNKPEQKAFLADLAKLAAALRTQIEAGCESFAPDASASAARRQKAQGDFAFFAATYFPHYTKFAPSKLHVWLSEDLPELLAGESEGRLALAAPRGEAKSTMVSLIFVLWTVLTGRKRYPVLLADSTEQACINLEAIKAELEFNPRLLMDYPEGTGPGRVWNAGVVITAGDVKIEAFGATKKVRGRRHGPWRPDLAIGDDLENDENVESPAQRNKLQRWLERSVLSLGGPGAKYDVIIVGTILHYDSVLSRLLKHPLWESKSFRAILQWPNDMALWDKWEEQLLNGTTPKAGEAAARAFYMANEAAMLAGAIVSWPEARPLYGLMLKRARDGHAAFDSEQQNDPLDNENAPFAACIQFWVNRLSDWLMYAALDPSLGKNGQGRDPSAILIGGLHKPSMVLSVIEADIKKRLPDRIIEDVIAYQRQYKCLLWAVEAVQFQEFLRTELMRRGAAAGVPIPARAVMPHSDKALRIESLQPYLAQGRILLHPSQNTLIAQLKHWPMADHDDGPDALHMLWEAALKGFGSIDFTPVPKRSGALSWSGVNNDQSDFNRPWNRWG